MLDYRIHTFLTLYQEMNYRKTAELLKMTQPGVTQHIQYLEKYYGVKLFEYNGRTLHRTKHAEILKRHIDSIRAGEIELASQFKENNMLHLRVGVTKTIGEYVIPNDICSFLQKPDHSLHLIIDNTAVLLSMLERSELDFAIIEGVFDKSYYEHHLYKKERFVGICSKQHPFANEKVSLRELLQQTLVLREPGSGTRKIFEQALLDKGYSVDCFHRCISLNAFSVITKIVASSSAITFAYEPVAVSNPNLSIFQVEDMQLQGEFNFVYCNRDIAENKINEFFKKY